MTHSGHASLGRAFLIAAIFASRLIGLILAVSRICRWSGALSLPVSTAATGYSTPSGSYTAFRMVRMHYSQEWDNAGMPHSIFFTKSGHAIHGSNHPRLGSPASHGCVRLSLSNAATLYELVQAYGMTETEVVVRGSDPPGVFPPTEAPEQRRVRSRQRRPFLPFFR